MSYTNSFKVLSVGSTHHVIYIRFTCRQEVVVVVICKQVFYNNNGNPRWISEVYKEKYEDQQV